MTQDQRDILIGLEYDARHRRAERFTDDEREALSAAIAIAEESRWRRLGDEKPAPHTGVILMHGQPMPARFSQGSFWEMFDIGRGVMTVVAARDNDLWMPLPSAPETRGTT